ncbi:amidohydrolase family protein [Ruegeria conchae]|uniref:amidohydrolase family protein n=1 Tax=Ruegeria conchae TaxID=981384 RepID=UPI0021A33F61|nr:amidohydrolase family protein [Ruegeria conchae]UWR01953.1 amidohydrolase family protein [Ruegeria conchae]
MPTRLSDALAPFTSNVADLLKLRRKGRLKVGMDADLVVLDENLAVRHVMALGGMACRRWPDSPAGHV